MRFICTLFFFGFSFNSLALDYFKSIPEQSVKTWIHGNNNSPPSLIVHYYWATWCGPCVISAKQLSELSDRLEGKISVLAYSDEPVDTIETYLKKRYPNQNLPFNYAQIKSKKKARDTELSHWVSSFPYLFITDNGKLVWHGNPTYPLKAFQHFLSLWEKGEWTPEAVAQKNSIDSASLKAIQVWDRNINDLLKKQIENEEKRSTKYKELFRQTENYIYFRDAIESDVQIFQAQERLMDHDTFEKFKKDFLSQRKVAFQGAAEIFGGNREELFFVARDLLFAKEPLQDLNLAETIIKKALILPEEGTTYPDYNFWVVALLNIEKGKWGLAKQFNDRALESCQKQNHCSQFVDIYRDSEKEIHTHMGTYCDSLKSCFLLGVKLF